jgi:phosphoribosylamine--glycine ligase/phosphoribosylformylglycinamidine cyclo-ligase
MLLEAEMKVLLIGSGGREHALAWKIAQSPRLTHLWVAPGNAGTCQHGENVPITADIAAELVHFAWSKGVDLAVIGPEAPLAAGLADNLRAMKIRTFGPSQAAAQIESSKVFAKAFMERHGIPTGHSKTFTDYIEALVYLRQSAAGGQLSVVIKASGLAAGKGVIVPDSLAEAEAGLRSIMVTRDLGPAGKEIIIEERLSGEEVSLLAFTDGVTVRPMPPAQDHKRLLDGDHGPNTGGMGAYAPAPICPPELAEEITRTVLQPAVDGLRAEGMPFVGVLYAGMMLTADGPRVLEFNCRFGDPETQVILPLLETDILDIAEACVTGHLNEIDIRWKRGTAACVVLASQGYPEKVMTGKLVSVKPVEGENVIVFHAGTKLQDNQVTTSGGRVLGVTGIGEDLPTALATAYRAVDDINFEGMQWRKDIGWRAFGKPEEGLQPETKEVAAPTAVVPTGSYAAAGVSIEAGTRAVELMKSAVKSTYGPEVLMGIGAFGGLYDAAGLKEMRAPVLVSSTDGVGTKVKLAAQAGRYRSIGQDIVNHCINDILVQGARPLFFLDYFATSKLQPEITAEVVAGIAEACCQAGCALIGGETAEMPEVYSPGEFDVAGTIVGVVEKDAILPRTADIRAGDVLIGLRSSGPHTNGYSLIRKIFEGVPLDTVFPELGIPLVDALLAPHRSYLDLLKPGGREPRAGSREQGTAPLEQRPIISFPQSSISNLQSKIKALAHLTGGGFIENIPRVLPGEVDAVIRPGNWPIPPLFTLIQQRGGIALEEMYRVFNMGIGMVIVVAPEQSAGLQAAITEETYRIGEIVSGNGKVVLR